MATTDLNERAARLVDATLTDADSCAIAHHRVPGGGRVVDCGIDAPGGLAAGIFLARLTLADLAQVAVAPGEVAGIPCPFVTVSTDHPVAACMASQYAGWRISVGDVFAMGSGPMRASYGGEELFSAIGVSRERAEEAIGALETRTLPTREIFEYIASKTEIEASAITLAVAPTASIAGCVQVVARSVETALHKLHEIGFDISRVASGFGSAPLPPPAADDLAALGRTNDSVLYGTRVHLWVRGDDDSLEDYGARVPASTSKDWGEPFGEIFARHDYDFYKIDPHLFSPAEVVFHNVETGRTFHFGERSDEVLSRSFFNEQR